MKKQPIVRTNPWTAGAAIIVFVLMASVCVVIALHDIDHLRTCRAALSRAFLHDGEALALIDTLSQQRDDLRVANDKLKAALVKSEWFRASLRSQYNEALTGIERLQCAYDKVQGGHRVCDDGGENGEGSDRTPTAGYEN